MERYKISGMSCEACRNRIEKAVKNISGVTHCSLNLLTEVMLVEGEVSDNKIIETVKDLGYGIVAIGEELTSELLSDEKETAILRKRFIKSLVLLLIFLYFTFGHNLLNLPLPTVLDSNTSQCAIQLFLSSLIIIINRKFFTSGFKALLSISPNMDTLVAIAAFASYAWSVYVVIRIFIDYKQQEMISFWMDKLFFESSAMVLTLITLGKLLEAKSKGKAKEAIKLFIDMMPEKATVIRGENEIVTDTKDIKSEDILVVKPGEKIPLDGIIISGITSVDESLLTGESMPVNKGIGSKVFAGTINQNGYINCEIIGTKENTKLSEIIRLVTDTVASKAPIAKLADKISGFFVPVVILISIVTLIIWILVGESFHIALSRAIAVLVVSCPCALGLATPVAVMAGSSLGAKNRIFFKNAISLEEMSKADIVVLDKTGTITNGKPAINDIIVFDDMSENDVLEILFLLEQKSEHILAKAVIKEMMKRGIKTNNVIVNFKYIPGKGLEGYINDTKVFCGSYNFIKEQSMISEEMENMVKDSSLKGETLIFVGMDSKVIGAVKFLDKIKADSTEAIRQIQKLGLEVVMLTGDNRYVSQEVAKEVKINNFVSEVLPDEKALIIKELKKLGKVIMVGDGINDGPSLVMADVGMAIGSGTDVAINSADIVLLNDKLTDVYKAIQLSRIVFRKIKENLFWAFFYNIISIPLAAGCFYGTFKLSLSPVLSAAMMSLSSICVITNAIRINFVNLSGEKGISQPPRIASNSIKQILDNITQNRRNVTVLKRIKIDGMMCEHCEARVKKIFEETDGVSNVMVSYKDGLATAVLNSDVDLQTIKEQVEKEGYKVIGID